MSERIINNSSLDKNNQGSKVLSHSRLHPHARTSEYAIKFDDPSPHHDCSTGRQKLLSVYKSGDGRNSKVRQ